MATTPAIIDFLNAPGGGTLYPVTLVDAVYDLNGIDLQTLLDEKLSASGPLYFTTSDSEYNYVSSVSIVDNSDDNTTSGKVLLERTKTSISDNSGTRSFIELYNDYVNFGSVDIDSTGAELPPQDGDAIMFDYYDSSIGDYNTAMSIDALTGDIAVYTKIQSSAIITAPQFKSTTPISITIGNCTKQWDGCSPLSFTLEEIGIDISNVLYRANATV